MVVAGLLPAMGSLTSLNLGDNQLCGLDGYGRGTYTADGITAIADALRVNGSLTSINMSRNHLTNFGEDMTGIKELAAALGVNGSLTSINLSNNVLCGMKYGQGTYTAEGITAIADALRVNGSLTKMRYVTPEPFGSDWTQRSKRDCLCTSLASSALV